MTNPMQKPLALLRDRYKGKVGLVRASKIVEDLDNILAQTYHDEEYHCACPSCEYHRKERPQIFIGTMKKI